MALSFRRHRVEKQRKLGEGTYAQVFAGYDHTTRRPVAIKRIRFDQDDGDIPTCVLREVTVLKRLGNHRHIVELLEVAIVPTAQCCDLLLGYVPQNLFQVLKQRGAFTLAQTAHFGLQLVEALRHCRACGVLHRDLKPQNILVDVRRNTLQLCDFGLSRVRPNYDHRLTNQVVTRWYRAPELLLGAKRYGFAIDMWSLGCVLAEMYLAMPLFQGKTDEETRMLIWKRLGYPRPSDWPNVSTLSRYNVNAPSYKLQGFPLRLTQRRTFYHLVRKLLVLNPTKRYTVTDAYRHLFFD